MNVVIINGSARKGNSLTAIEAFLKGANKENKIEIIQCDKLNIAPCKGCNACGMANGCIDKDDTNATVDKIVAADMILFVSPVYWWGITAQMKLVIDKCYSKGAKVLNKKIATIIVGGSPLDNPQYELIRRQFECMAEYLNWEILFQKSYFVSAPDELAQDENAVKELTDCGAVYCG